jgi:hypothetical protein
MSVTWAIKFFKVFLISLLVWGFSYWRSLQVPTLIHSIEALQKEPIQTTSSAKPFVKMAKGHSYHIEPVHDYEIWGLVVSDHYSDSWYDTVHEAWNDYLNTKDICVVWGSNVLNPHLPKLKFSHGAWTCYVNTRSRDAWEKFNMNQFSNNHIIPANVDIGRLIANSNVGDEIRIKGHLVNYKIDNGPPRTSSTIRTDTGNGACEIIYVNEFSTLARHNKFWVSLKKISFLSSALSLIAALFCIFILPFLISKQIDIS